MISTPATGQRSVSPHPRVTPRGGEGLSCSSTDACRRPYTQAWGSSVGNRGGRGHCFVVLQALWPQETWDNGCPLLMQGQRTHTHCEHTISHCANFVLCKKGFLSVSQCSSGFSCLCCFYMSTNHIHQTVLHHLPLPSVTHSFDAARSPLNDLMANWMFHKQAASCQKVVL